MRYRATLPRESAASILRESMTLFPAVRVSPKQKPNELLAVTDIRENDTEKERHDFAVPELARNRWRKLFPVPQKGYAPAPEEETVWTRFDDLGKNIQGEEKFFWPWQDEPSDYSEITSKQFHEKFLAEALREFSGHNLGGGLAEYVGARISRMRSRRDFRREKRERARQRRRDNAYKREDYRRQLNQIMRMVCASVLSYGSIFTVIFSVAMRPLVLGEMTGNVWSALVCLLIVAAVGGVYFYRKSEYSPFSRLALITLGVCVAAFVSLYPCMRGGKLRVWLAVFVPIAVGWSIFASVHAYRYAPTLWQVLSHWAVCVFFAIMCLGAGFNFFNALPFDGHDGIYYYTVNADGTLTVTVQTLSKDVTLTVPQTIDGRTVTAVARSGITYNGKNMHYIGLPSTVTRVDPRAFADCVNVQYADVPLSALPYIPTARIEELRINGGGNLSAAHLAQLPRLGLLTVGGQVRRIEEGAFADCAVLWGVEIQKGVTQIGREAFRNCKRLTSVTLPQGLQEIEAYAFADCFALTYVDFPEELTCIGEGAFSGCTDLRKAVLPPLVQTVFADTFRGCARLQEVGLPLSVTSIGANAFYGCPLQTVYYGGDDARWVSIVVEEGNEPLFAAQRKKDRI